MYITLTCWVRFKSLSYKSRVLSKSKLLISKSMKAFHNTLKERKKERRRRRRKKRGHASDWCDKPYIRPVIWLRTFEYFVSLYCCYNINSIKFEIASSTCRYLLTSGISSIGWLTANSNRDLARSTSPKTVSSSAY